MALIDRPCYATRELVRRALDVTMASYHNDLIDGAIIAGSEDVEEICQRKFFTTIATRSFDWPNYQYAYPWRLWLNDAGLNELAGSPSLVVTGSLLPIPIVIPSNAYILQPINSGPPFTYIELRRDMNFGFGNNTTPQLDIAITGPFGYWQKTRAAGTFAANVNAGDSTVQVSNGGLVGAGDVLIAGTESMIVNDTAFIDTGLSFLTGITTVSAADNVGSVSNGALFAVGEILLVDFEWMLVQNVVGNNIVVKRAYSGSVLSAHSGGHIFASRQLSVLRGQLGTTAAGYSSGQTISVANVPAKVRELALAEALSTLVAQPGAYSQSIGGLMGGVGQGAVMGNAATGQQREPIPGTGLPDLRNQMLNSKYARKARSRVV